jgi:acyl-CoA dehydrogenase
VSDEFVRALDKLLASSCPPEVVAAAEHEWPAQLWDAVAASGIPLVGVSESQGGAGGGWPEMVAVIRASARYAAPIPLAESILARHLADRAGLDLPDGPIAIDAGCGATLDDRGRLTGTLTRVPWARSAAAVVVRVSGGGSDRVLARIDPAKTRIERGANIAREPRDLVRLDAVPVAVADGADLGVQRAGALARAAQISGALERVLELSVEYARTRQQFGRPIAKFQAVQQLIALLAGESAAARAAVDAAARGGARTGDVAAAKIRSASAASEGARIAHQLHGAIGVTHEHQLRHFTTRLWSWRDEFGTQASWTRTLGARLTERGASGFMDWLTAAPEAAA